MNAYYNEHDAYPAQWLRNLSDAGHITAGRVDARSIKEVLPDDIKKATRAHFFAGIGGWDYALQLAGWPADAEVWTGSCPCQPFSNAGKGKGIEDERHLWPVWFDLIESCRPAVIFGEQVVSPAGRQWWDAVSADLEGLGYSTRAFDLCAAGVGAPHIRQRLFWVGNATSARHEGGARGRRDGAWGLSDKQPCESAGGGMARGGGGMARGGDGRLGNADSRATGQHARELPSDESQHDQRQADGNHTPQPENGADRLGDTHDERLEGRGRRRNSAYQRPSWPSGMVDARGAGSLAGQWAKPDWLYCRDGKRRPVESGTQPLANGLPGRVGQLRAYGNAIIPQAAAALIRATMEAIH